MRVLDLGRADSTRATSPYDFYRQRAHRLRAATFRLTLRRLRKRIGCAYRGAVRAYRLDAAQPNARIRKLTPVAR